MPKVKVSVWVEPHIKKALQAMAIEQSKRGAVVTISDVVNAFLDLGVKGEIEGTYEALLGAKQARATRHAIGRMADKMASMLHRIALEATTTRLIVLHEIQVAKGRAYEANLYLATHNHAKDLLDSPDRGLEMLIKEYLSAQESPQPPTP